MWVGSRVCVQSCVWFKWLCFANADLRLRGRDVGDICLRCLSAHVSSCCQVVFGSLFTVNFIGDGSCLRGFETCWINRRFVRPRFVPDRRFCTCFQFRPHMRTADLTFSFPPFFLCFE